jgi:hypothetical protein
MAILGIFLWKLGPWNYRQRILSYEFPEGWQNEIEQTLHNYEHMSAELKKSIQQGLKILMAEKQWQTSESNDQIHKFKLKALIIGAWTGANTSDPYFKRIENLELGILSSYYTLSIQYDSKGIYSQKWFQPALLQELGISQFSYTYRGVIAEWASNLQYQQNLFQDCIGHLNFDLSLFPLFFEVYLTDSDALQKALPKLTSFYEEFLDS